jgi:UDP-sugar transporter A1/2/3
MVIMSKKETQISSMFSDFKPNGSSFKLLLLTLMVLQNSSVVLIGRYTRDSQAKEDVYVVNHLILVCECMKFVFACLLEFKMTNGQLYKSFKENVFDTPLDALKIIIPSLLYLFQNTLLYVALSNLSAPLFQVTYQSKLLTTAVVSVIMLQRKYSPKQWVCLTTLGFGVAFVVLGATESKPGEDDESESGQSLFTGLVAVSCACFSSALAGVYFEKVLKKPTSDGAQTKAPVSLWMRNIQMAFFSVCIACFNNYGNIGIDVVDQAKEFCHGFTTWVWVLALLQAGGGLLVAAVIKYADNVLKGLATGVSVVTSTACSMVLFGTPLTTQFGIGAIIILCSVFFFSNDIPGGKAKVGAVEEKKSLASNLV